ncbi:UDP-glycosyltransferase [Melia azedarach]|uniref:UDP-glycosyltransferase n=1 Tax=Melia azedarach TaxID=155640 RepID=A0ACC1X7D3_MELAZ|nr:UDP-glycosyltransferase [Melia azedarach]
MMTMFLVLAHIEKNFPSSRAKIAKEKKHRMGNPHVLVIPYPAQGHVIPLMELSQCLVKHGFRITFVNTEYNHKLVKNALSVKEDKGDLIHLVSIPDGLESLEDRNKPGKISEAILRVMPGNVEKLIEEINSSENDRISCVLADQSIGWALEIAEKKGIKRAAFCPAAAALLVLSLSVPKLIDDGIIDDDGTPTKRQIIKLSTTMPAMNTENFVWACLGNKLAQMNIFELMVNNNRSLKLTDWLLCNSTYDLEPAAFALAPEILPIGPLLASTRLGDSAASFWPEDSTCLKWLDERPPKSVIYVAFGSFTVFDPTQFQELATGLELSNKPFLWVVGHDFTDKMNNFFSKGFLDRVADRGKMVSWAPQQKVLQHPSIACFMSHCGWNSTMEGVGIGFTRNERGIIPQEEVKRKVEQLLISEEYKERASNLKEMVLNNIKEGGSSYKNFKNFIDWLKTEACSPCVF